MLKFNRLILITLVAGIALSSLTATAQNLEEILQRTALAELAAGANQWGDAARGAIIFHQPGMACAKCHAIGSDRMTALGPDLTALGGDVTDELLIESLLYPSKVIRQGFESVTILTVDGRLISALPIQQTPDQFTLRDVARDGELVTLPMADIEDIKQNELSIMPAGQMNQLSSRQQFYDLVRYLMEIRDGGAARAQQLQPSAALLTYSVPEYENRIDHAGLIRSWNADSFRRGEAVYRRVCANCHGTHDQVGSLPTSLRFQDGQFKNGHDPLSIYRTLTHGFGQMTPQTWMVPSQKYDVIHFIRQAYLEPSNTTQYFDIDEAYLASLPQGDTFGPEPSHIEAWSAMNYGPHLTHTYEVPGPMHNFAYKGIAVRLDPGAGGVSRGRHWMVFDTDTLRVAAAWHAGADGSSQDNFIDWRAIQFNGEHGIHPRIVGRVDFANSTGPGWGDPRNGSFHDDQRVLGRDGKQYGPLPQSWGRFRGCYHHDQQVILSYTIGTTDVLEMPRLLPRESSDPVILRSFNLGARQHDLILQVAQQPATGALIRELVEKDRSAVCVASVSVEPLSPSEVLRFDGETFVEIENVQSLDVTDQDFSITARIKTKADGTIFSINDGGERWIPNGQTLFVRGGRLVFDIGWVGAVTGRSRIDDNQWHRVAMTWEQATQRVRLYVDGKLDGEGTLAAKAAVGQAVARIGFTSPNFPQPSSFFQGEIADVRFYQQCFIDAATDLSEETEESSRPLSSWTLVEQHGSRVADQTGNGHDGQVRRGSAPTRSSSGPLVAGYAPKELQFEWLWEDGNLRLRIPAGDQPLRFSVWVSSYHQSNSDNGQDSTIAGANFEIPPILDAAIDLNSLIQGGPSRWPEVMTSEVVLGAESGPFAVDILTAPETNPWLALTRFTGLDFFPDGRIAVCTWDGDVWVVALRQEDHRQLLDWRRIASGMFQPLGLKVSGGKIHVICRDQLTVLHDLNDDGEIDYYQCLNNDHQVTEHFHEFAMGLQTDEDGNFYYAKSGCHGKAAVVPHHGTLLKVARDGSRTEILANGFRAANGVCLNPDGSFVVTDQEGFWNPKNRINWVTLSDSGVPKFYGNMLGYHDVTDESDAAMEPPLCWITNDFDRSPAELLWVDSQRWGPLQGALLNLSYGYGKVFLVPFEKVNGMTQGGMIELPLPTFPTGIMRGRFHPVDGQLYVCGMYAWAGSATHPGGLYRIRYTDQPVGLPLALRAYSWGVEIAFAEPVDPDSIGDLRNYSVEAWDLRRTARYGSDHINQRVWRVESAQLMADGTTLQLRIPDIAPTWGMEIIYSLKSADGRPLQGKIHNTIHQVRDHTN